MNKIVWLTGHSKAGKSTIGDALAEEVGGVVLHGDDMRASISLDLKDKYDKESRRENNLRTARLAKVLSQQTLVIVAVIAPSVEARKEVESICNPIWIHIHRPSLPYRENHWYEVSPEYPSVDTDELTIPEAVIKVRELAGLNPCGAKSMLIGRYQPLHEGHKKLIQTVLDEGREVVVALRDTSYGGPDPYTIGERKEMFHDAFGDKVQVIVIPDITEVVYGRNVGWGIRQINLDEATEAISATKIRAQTEGV